MKIGLVGEAPNDTKSIQNLLSRKYPDLQFVELLSRIDGTMLDNRKAIQQIRREFELNQPDVVIFIRDLDSLENDKVKKKERQVTFTRSNRMVNKTGIPLLNIYELETLILADINVFNKEYNCEVEQYKDPMNVWEPKEVLAEASRKSPKPFIVTHTPKLFGLLNFDMLNQNCRYFSAFIKKFNKAIG